MNDLIDLAILKIFPISLTMFFLFISLISSKFYKNWINPASIFSIFWFIYTFFPLILAWDVPINSLAVIYLISASFVFAVSGVFFNWRSMDDESHQKLNNKYSIKINSLFRIFFSMVAISMILIFLDLMTQGVVFNGNIVDFAGQLASLRYAEELVANNYSKISNIINYAIPSIGGVMFAVFTSRWRRLFVILLAFLPLIFVLVSQSAKGPFLLGGALFLNGILICKLISGQRNLITLSELKKTLPYVFFIIALMIFSFLSRGVNLEDADGRLQLYSYLVSYSSGHLYAFADWLQFEISGNSVTSYDNINLTYGFYTFMGFFRILGDGRLIPVGTYEEVFNYNNFVITNVYTIFRGLVTDFGILGSLVVLFVAGVFFNFCYYFLRFSRKTFIGFFGFSLFFSMCYQSFIISSLQWTSVWMGIALFSFLLKISLKIKSGV